LRDVVNVTGNLKKKGEGEDNKRVAEKKMGKKAEKIAPLGGA